MEADIRAENVSVAGRFKGNIVVKGKAQLARGGRVDGNITSKVLIVEEGGVFQGQSVMDQQAAQAPAPQAPAKPAQAAQEGPSPENAKVP
ncbi:MAG: polymer-forming cytoskeletal protein [Actinobacteria bacterium]|nr:polymer-forming cytoskeletal protein [Actinomycetota bacterium]